jgi:hypothetical protein
MKRNIYKMNKKDLELLTQAFNRELKKYNKTLEEKRDKNGSLV